MKAPVELGLFSTASTFAATGARPLTFAKHDARARVPVGCAVKPQSAHAVRNFPSPGTQAAKSGTDCAPGNLWMTSTFARTPKS